MNGVLYIAYTNQKYIDEVTKNYGMIKGRDNFI